MKESISNKISNITKTLIDKFFVLLGSIILVNIAMGSTLIFFSIMIFGKVTAFAYMTGGTFFGLMIGMIMNERTFLRLKKYILGIHYMKCCKRTLCLIDTYEELLQLNADIMEIEQDLKD